MLWIKFIKERKIIGKWACYMIFLHHLQNISLTILSL